MGETTVVAMLGLGEAGTAIEADLLAAGATVRGYDPVAPIPDGVIACGSEGEAVGGADVVLSANSADAALTALRNGAPGCAPGQVWADLNTASPGRKQELAAAVPAGVLFVDVALMSTVPGSGVHTPMTASGPGARRFAELMEPLGAHVTVLDGDAGEAAARKLLRSVFFKGLAAAVVESLEAARAHGLEDVIRAEIERELDDASAATVARLEDGSRRHAVRRSHEMSAAVELLGELGVPARVSAASRDWLDELAARDGR